MKTVAFTEFQKHAPALFFQGDGGNVSLAKASIKIAGERAQRAFSSDS